MICFKNYELKQHTTFKIGGLAGNIYFPQTVSEFVILLDSIENPVIIGNCSNLLISSIGIDGNVICTKKLDKYEFKGNKLYSQVGTSSQLLSAKACENCLSGLEFAAVIPATIGGMVYMNASAHSQKISDIVKSVKVYNLKSKKTEELTNQELNFSYRNSILREKNYVLLEINFELTEENKDKIRAKINENIEYRKINQPNLSTPNAGSVFKNPENNSAGMLLESVGAKEFSVNDAEVSKLHANFIINSGNATSQDVVLLMKKMYNAVYEKFNIALKPEIEFVGTKDKVEEEIWQEFLTH